MPDKNHDFATHESSEDYLEAILVLQKQKGNVHSIDLANHMGYSKPSISRAVGLLRDNGYIYIDDNGCLQFTEAGRSYAEKIYERHCFFTEHLMKIGVDEKTAQSDACRIEHVISDETFEKLKASAKANE